MATCKNCGKPLENPDQELCPACRAVENAKARTRREEKAGHARRRRMNRTTRKMLIAVCVLAVVFTGLCVTATVMYDKYNPDEFIASVDAALEAGDARALKNLLSLGGIQLAAVPLIGLRVLRFGICSFHSAAFRKIMPAAVCG